MSAAIVERFRACFEHQLFTELSEVYAEDASFELHVGDSYEQRKGPDAIVARYIEDYDPPPTFLRWEARVAPWGAVVEGDAIQGEGRGRARYRWVHILTIEEDRIVNDTIYCTGAVPFADIDTVGNELDAAHVSSASTIDAS